jgi:outer membrane protein TolC
MKRLFLHLTWLCSTSVSGLLLAAPLQLDQVLQTVRTQYPPLLAAWLQQDIANGRIRQAAGAFDPMLIASLNFRPLDYYEGANVSFLIDQPLLSGGSVYGGYRVSTGDLASYDRKDRTSSLGEAVVGARIPLWRDRQIDARRANLGRAAVDRELADPLILRQYITFHRAARIAYYNWIAAGQRLLVAEDVLRIAKERDEFLKKQAEEGAIAPIVLVDNRRIVVSREIAVLNTSRRFDAASIELSLFLRDTKTTEPLLPLRGQLPAGFPKPQPVDQLQYVSDRARATYRRPEVREIDLLVHRGEIDKRLANNNLKPNLDLAMELNQAIGNDVPSDIKDTEVNGLLRFSVPIGLNEARGRLQDIEASIKQLKQRRQFACEQIQAESNNTFQEVQTAFEALDKTTLNVTLAKELEEAESDRFEQGATDLLALQIREQATLDAKLLEIDAYLAFFRALADYEAAVATDAPTSLLSRAESAK